MVFGEIGGRILNSYSYKREAFISRNEPDNLGAVGFLLVATAVVQCFSVRTVQRQSSTQMLEQACHRCTCISYPANSMLLGLSRTQTTLPQYLGLTAISDPTSKRMLLSSGMDDKPPFEVTEEAWPPFKDMADKRLV